MKLTHKLCGAVLLAAVGVAVAVPGITKADAEADRTLAGDMDIQFTRNTADDTNTTRDVITDPSGSQDTDIVSGTITRPLRPVTFGVQDVTPLSFGENSILTDGSARTFWAKNYEEPAGVMANNVVIKDTRVTANHGYTLTAQITEPLKATYKEGNTTLESKLTGSELKYTNIGVKSNVADKIALSSSKVKLEATVSEDKAAIVVDNSKKEGDSEAEKLTGQGQSYIHFGKLTATGIGASDKSVQLTIKNEHTLFDAEYTGQVTWVMTAAK